MKSYLVTGAAGFIGSYVARALLERGHRVITLDNLSTGFRSQVPEGTVFIEGDCQDPEVIRQLEGETLEAVYHIAGQSSGEVSFEDPVYDLQTNAQSTLQLLDLCRKIKCHKFIYASSMSVYGEVPDRPVAESQVPVPKSFYGVGKLASEHYLRLYTQFGIGTVALRLFNVYGPGQNMENMKQGMVSIFLAQALRSQQIRVKGAPDRFRDFVYIDDVVSAFLRTEELLVPGSAELFNVCSGVKTRVGELVDLLCSYLPFEVSREFQGSTPGDQFGIYGDPALFHRKTALKAPVALKDGLKRMVEYALAQESAK